MPNRIAIIGAGVSGLCAARHSLAAGYEVTVFEQSDRLGGTWVYRPEVGTNEHGLEIHSSMYEGLVTNIPKEIMSYPDVPFPDQPASFIPAVQVLSYLDAFADRFALRPHIRFNHHVQRCRPIDDHQDSATPSRWELTVRDLDAKTTTPTSFIYDAVFVCNGHFSEPKWPAFASAGRHLYSGNLMHSHAFRNGAPFAGRRVLVVGSGPSGRDIAAAVCRVAQRTDVSYHRWTASSTVGGGGGDDGGIRRRPGVEAMTAAGVRFVDGAEQQYDDVIVCTGYKYAFPFLSAEECGLWVEEEAFVRPLFKECVNIERQSMFVVGLPFRVCPFQMVDFQVRFCLAFLAAQLSATGQIIPGWPSADEMRTITSADMQKRRDKYGGLVRHMHMLESFQAEYYADLAHYGRLEPLKPYVLRIYEDSKVFGMANPERMRQQQFRLVEGGDGGEYVKTMAESVESAEKCRV